MHALVATCAQYDEELNVELEEAATLREKHAAATAWVERAQAQLGEGPLSEAQAPALEV